METTIRKQRELRDTGNMLDGLMDFFVPSASGIPTLEFPEGRIMGIPQRAYGYLTNDIRKQYGIDGLQTANIFSCKLLAGYNKNGSFLAHLDGTAINESEKMLERLLSELGADFRLFMSYNKTTKRATHEKKMTCKLERLFGKHALSLEMVPKLSFQELRIGITYDGRLFHPKNFVKNDAAYGEENALQYGALASQIKWEDWRKHLACMNDIEGKL